MPIDDALARLTAGLDRDEAIVRELLDDEIVGADWTYSVTGRDDGFEDGWVDDGVRAVGGPGDSNGKLKHIARHDPARVLRQVERIRKAVADAQDPKSQAFKDYESGLLDYDSFRAGVEAATDLFVETLAGIYTDPTADDNRANQ